MQGYVYVIVNEGYPDWCKVGFTKRAPAQRLAEYQTYSPFTYKIYHVVHFDNAHEAERRIHGELRAFVQKNKEWFKLPANIASNIIDGVKEDIDSEGEI